MKFYREGVAQEVPETEVREWVASIAYNSDGLGLAYIVLSQCFKEIDRLRILSTPPPKALEEEIAELKAELACRPSEVVRDAIDQAVALTRRHYEQGWVASADGLPGFGQKCWIAQRYKTVTGEMVWIPYSGHRSEDKDNNECWFADDDNFLPLTDTWWMPVNWPLPTPPGEGS